MAYTAQKLLDIARAEIGYKEKASNSQLDDKTANAGSNNWTKYARDLHAAGYYQAPKNGYAWCDMFVDWDFLKLGGSKEKGEWLECQTGLYGAGCEWSSNCYRWAGRFGTEPKIGAQIFFGKAGAEEHTGIVENFDDKYVYTIEGNTSNMVARRTYARTSSYIVGYGYPRYDEEEEVKPVAPTVTGTPSTGSDADAKKIWDFLKGKGLNDYATAGIMGNLYAECALRSNNLQNTYEKSLGYTDAEYTAAVDNGSYTNFVRDSAGYGLAQWTYWSRKENLLNFAKAANKSIGDLQMQLDFLWKELQGYKNVMNVLKNAKSIREASDVILTEFERPADQSENAKVKRASYGQKYYDKFVEVVKPVEPAKPVEPTPVEPTPVEPKPADELKVGDIVNFTGNTHYVSSNSTNAKPCKPGKAKITATYKGKHPYHLIKVSGGGSTVYGWVDAADIETKVTDDAQAHKEKIDRLAREVIQGKYGNGTERKQKLGDLYPEVQKRVNEILG